MKPHCDDGDVRLFVLPIVGSNCIVIIVAREDEVRHRHHYVLVGVDWSFV